MMTAWIGAIQRRLDTTTWQKAGVILLLLLAEALVGLSGHLPIPLPSNLVMGAPLAACFTLLFLLQFELGLALTILSFLAPITVFSFATAEFGVMPFLVLLLFGLYLAKGLLVERRIQLQAPGTLPLLSLAVVSIISVMYSYVVLDPNVGTGRDWSQGHRWIGYQAMGIFLFAYAWIAYVISANGVRSKGWLWAIYFCILAVCAYVVIIPLPGYLQELKSITAFLHPKGRLMESASGTAAMIMALLTLAMLLYERRGALRLAFLILFTLAMLNLILSYFLNTWLGFLAGAAIIARRRSAKASLVFVLLLLVVALLAWDVISLISEQRFQPGSADLRRLDIWRNALQTWLKSPLIGVGNANLASYIIAYGPFPVERVASGKAHPHNTYLGILAENGLLGLGCLLWLIVAFVSNVWVSIDEVGDPRLRGVAAGCLATFVASATTALFAEGVVPLYTAGGVGNLSGAAFLWLLYGLGVAATRIGKCTSA